MECAVRDAEKFHEGWAEIGNPEKVKGMAEGGALWGGGMAGVDFKKKRCDCVGQFNLSRILIEEN